MRWNGMVINKRYVHDEFNNGNRVVHNKKTSKQIRSEREKKREYSKNDIKIQIPRVERVVRAPKLWYWNFGLCSD